MLLWHYVPNPSEFRAFMREHNCVISGLAVLWLIEGLPSHWHPHSMNIWIPNGATHHVEKYLQTLGYEGWDWALLSRKSGFKSITKYINEYEDQIWIMESTTLNPIMPITRLQTTVQMNYLEPDFLVSFYPALTLGKVCVVQNLWNLAPPRWLQRQHHRGYIICQQLDWIPNWIKRLNLKFPREKGDRRKFIVPITRDSSLPPSNGLPRFLDMYPHPHEFPFDPTCHLFCASSHQNMPESHKLALAALHSPHVLW
jgi:hypothetical protein